MIASKPVKGVQKEPGHGSIICADAARYEQPSVRCLHSTVARSQASSHSHDEYGCVHGCLRLVSRRHSAALYRTQSSFRGYSTWPHASWLVSGLLSWICTRLCSSSSGGIYCGCCCAV